VLSPSTGRLLAFAVTALVVIVIPGPSVLFVVGRALAGGRRVAVLTVVGNALGEYVQVPAVAVGVGALAAGGFRAWFARSPRRLELIGGAGGLAIVAVGAGLLVSGRKN
jgi:threonine/homoserine/homoserine lactone efflux protein